MTDKKNYTTRLDGDLIQLLAERANAESRSVHELINEILRSAVSLPSPPVSGEALQDRVKPWMTECFGEEISADKLERGDRHLEEVLELLQSGDYPRERVSALTDYVYNRPKGEPSQEVGGVMITLAAYCLAHGLDMHDAGEVELARIKRPEIIAKIRAKQAAKPTGSALPVALSPLTNEPVGQFDTSDYIIVGSDGKPRRNESVGGGDKRQASCRAALEGET